jgi:hypothetical protein
MMSPEEDVLDSLQTAGWAGCTVSALAEDTGRDGRAVYGILQRLAFKGAVLKVDNGPPTCWRARDAVPPPEDEVVVEDAEPARPVDPSERARMIELLEYQAEQLRAQQQEIADLRAELEVVDWMLNEAEARGPSREARLAFVLGALLEVRRG